MPWNRPGGNRPNGQGVSIPASVERPSGVHGPSRAPRDEKEETLKFVCLGYLDESKWDAFFYLHNWILEQYKRFTVTLH